jgi:hypothetical protein
MGDWPSEPPTPPTAATRAHTHTHARDTRGERVCAVSFRSRVFVRGALECKQQLAVAARCQIERAAAGRALRPNRPALQGQRTAPSAAPFCLPSFCLFALPVLCCSAAAALLFPLCRRRVLSALPFALCSLAFVPRLAVLPLALPAGNEP